MCSNSGWFGCSSFACSMGATFSWLGAFLEQIGLKQKACNIVLLGLDNAGKTTLLNLLLTGKFQRFDRTMRARQQTVSVGAVKFNAWDLGGHEAARSSWSDFYLQSGGVVFMVDAADAVRLSPSCNVPAVVCDCQCRLQEAVDEFHGVLQSSRYSARFESHRTSARHFTVHFGLSLQMPLMLKYAAANKRCP
jgi:hypothetical protein